MACKNRLDRLLKWLVKMMMKLAMNRDFDKTNNSFQKNPNQK
jgi:hypothetical protein